MESDENRVSEQQELIRRVTEELRDLARGTTLNGTLAERRHNIETLAPDIGSLPIVVAANEQARAEAELEQPLADVVFDVLDRESAEWPDRREQLALRYGLGVEGAGPRSQRLQEATLILRDEGVKGLSDSTLETEIAKKDLLQRFADRLVIWRPPATSPIGAEESPKDGRRGDEELNVSENSGESPTDRHRPIWLAVLVSFVAGLLVMLGAVVLLDGVRSDDGTAADDGGSASSAPADSATTRATDTTTPLAEGATVQDDVDDSEPSQPGTSASVQVTTERKAPEPVQLVTLDPVQTLGEANGRFFITNRELSGTDTGRIFVASVDWAEIHRSAEISFNLDQQYETLRLQITSSPTSDPDGPLTVTATLDGGTILFSDTYAVFEEVEEIREFDISGSQRLDILVENTEASLCNNGSDFGCQVLFLVAELDPTNE